MTPTSQRQGPRLIFVFLGEGTVPGAWNASKPCLFNCEGKWGPQDGCISPSLSCQIGICILIGSQVIDVHIQVCGRPIGNFALLTFSLEWFCTRSSIAVQ